MSTASTSSSPSSPLATYELVSTLVEAWLYGLNCVLYISAVYIICRRRSPFQSLLILSSSILILLATAHFWVNGTALYQAIVAILAMPANMQAAMEATPLYCESCSSALSLVDTVLYLFTTLTQDLILLWRLFVVWQHWWLVALGAILELVCIGTITPALISIANPNNSYTSPFVYQLVVAFYAQHLFFNFSVTILIIAKLWLMGRKLESFFPGNGSPYARGMGIMVESGALYTLATAVNLGLYAARHPFAYVFTNVLTQLATLTPLLIVVRVGYTLSSVGSASSQATTALQFPSDVARESPATQMIRGRQTKLQQRAQDQARLREMRIAVRREVEFANAAEAPSQDDLERDSFDLEMEEMTKKGKARGAEEQV